jgi:hypothetical protein
MVAGAVLLGGVAILVVSFETRKPTTSVPDLAAGANTLVKSESASSEPACPRSSTIAQGMEAEAQIFDSTPSATKLLPSSPRWHIDSALPASVHECEYSFNYNEGSDSEDGAGTLEVAIIPDPNGSQYLQMADALIQSGADTSQPSPPLGEESIDDGFISEILVGTGDGYTLEFNDGYYSDDNPGFVGNDLEPVAAAVLSSING